MSHWLHMSHSVLINGCTCAAQKWMKQSTNTKNACTNEKRGMCAEAWQIVCKSGILCDLRLMSSLHRQANPSGIPGFIQIVSNRNGGRHLREQALWSFTSVRLNPIHSTTVHLLNHAFPLPHTAAAVVWAQGANTQRKITREYKLSMQFCLSTLWEAWGEGVLLNSLHSTVLVPDFAVLNL